MGVAGNIPNQFNYAVAITSAVNWTKDYTMPGVSAVGYLNIGVAGNCSTGL